MQLLTAGLKIFSYRPKVSKLFSYWPKALDYSVTILEELAVKLENAKSKHPQLMYEAAPEYQRRGTTGNRIPLFPPPPASRLLLVRKR